MHLVIEQSMPLAAAGGHCYACHSLRPGGAGYLRTYIDVVGEGEIVLCLPCAGQIAAACGYVSPETVTSIKAENVDLHLEAKSLREKAAAFDLFHSVYKKMSTESEPEVDPVASEPDSAVEALPLLHEFGGEASISPGVAVPPQLVSDVRAPRKRSPQTNAALAAAVRKAARG